MRFFLLIFLFPTVALSDQGLDISCIKIFSMPEKNPKIYKFNFDIISFKYFDENKNSFQEVSNKHIIIRKDFFAVRLPEYELGFQVNVFEDDKKPIMTMSKYDYINNKFLEHYYCDVQRSYVD